MVGGVYSDKNVLMFVIKKKMVAADVYSEVESM